LIVITTPLLQALTRMEGRDKEF